MQRTMVKLDGLLARRRYVVLGIWVALLAVATPLAMHQSDHLTGGGFGVPGSQSQAVVDAANDDFPAAPKSTLAAVLVPQPGATARDLRAAVRRVARAGDAVADVTLPAPAERRALAQAGAAPGRTLVVPYTVAVGEDASSDRAVDLRDELGITEGARDRVATHLIGQGALWAGLQDVTKKNLAAAEGVGFPIVLLILVVIFGSLAAAALPLALGVVSVVVTGAEIYLLSQAMDMSVFVTNMASMIGIGVAVDYSLFVLARYREEIHAGASPDAARATALATSGLAVIFSGMTVVVSLGGLWLIDNQALRSMALGAMLVVAVSVLAAATLLPVLLRILGPRAYVRNRAFTVGALVRRSWSRRRPGSTRPGVPRLDVWQRWTAFVTRRPVVSIAVSAGILLVLALPTLALKTGTGALRQFPGGNETRAGFEAAAKVTGPGAAAPFEVVARFRHGGAATPANARVTGALRRTLAADPAIARLGTTYTSKDRRAVLLTATPRLDGESDGTKAAVGRLRAALPRTAGAAAAIDVGGATARQHDVQNLISGSMWKIILFVLGLSYVVLLILLRSVVLPLKAVLMNLLSVGAAYGVLVVVFQWGWFDGLLGFDSLGHLDTLTPPLVLAVVFGLSMDYEVFLLTRIRERWEATGDTNTAVAEGLAHSARTITSAAVIMAAVFAVFVFTGVPSIKELGLGNAVAILVDATLVRLVLVPAVMELLGKWNWWLPQSLDRVLPHADFDAVPSALGGGDAPAERESLVTA